MSESRMPGWYWVKCRHGKWWEAAQWNGYSWHAVWIDDAPDSYFGEIGPRIPTPDEPWQCVPTGGPTEEMLFKAEAMAKNKGVDIYSPQPTEHPDDGGGIAGYYYQGLLQGAPKPEDEV